MKKAAMILYAAILVTQACKSKTEREQDVINSDTIAVPPPVPPMTDTLMNRPDSGMNNMRDTMQR